MHKNHVSGKIKCIFECEVVETLSAKHKYQPSVVAGKQMTEEFAKCLQEDNLRPTIKLDGTSCYVAKFNGKPWLFARHDIRPNKSVARKYKEYQHKKNESWLKNDKLNTGAFVWNLETDYKFPKNWISACNNAEMQVSSICPTDNGHLVGWVPVDPSARTHIWHLSAVDLICGRFVCLNEKAGDESLVARIEYLDDYLGKTFELIGTKVNGNPYDIGTSDFPIHFFVQHGELSLKNCPQMPLSREVLQNWFDQEKDGCVEGIVWHGPNGSMFKIHRHHLGLSWPIKNTPFSSRSVHIDCNGFTTGDNILINKIVQYSGQTFNKLQSVFK